MERSKVNDKGEHRVRSGARKVKGSQRRGRSGKEGHHVAKWVPKSRKSQDTYIYKTEEPFGQTKSD